MNKIPPFRSVPFLTFFPVFLLPLGMLIDSEIMDEFLHSMCLNDCINLYYMIGSFASGANVSFVAKIGTKDLATSCSVNRISNNGRILTFRVSK